MPPVLCVRPDPGSDVDVTDFIEEVLPYSLASVCRRCWC
jgi:hypothetical protein